MVGSPLIFRMIDIGDAHAGRMAKANGVMAGLFYIVFGIIWITMCGAIPSAIGILFMVVGALVIAFGALMIVRTIRNGGPQSFRARTSHPEEPSEGDQELKEYSGYCPYCGSPAEEDHDYCRVCGKRIG